MLNFRVSWPEGQYWKGEYLRCGPGTSLHWCEFQARSTTAERDAVRSRFPQRFTRAARIMNAPGLAKCQAGETPACETPALRSLCDWPGGGIAFLERKFSARGEGLRGCAYLAAPHGGHQHGKTFIRRFLRVARFGYFLSGTDCFRPRIAAEGVETHAGEIELGQFFGLVHECQDYFISKVNSPDPKYRIG